MAMMRRMTTATKTKTMTKTRKRVLLYSHDTYGLGHLRRSLAIAWSVSQHIPRSRQLLITGSAVAGAFSLPPRLDMVKLPSISKRSSGAYMPRSLPIPVEEIIDWRADMIRQAAAHFQPDLVLVDKAPAGALGELLLTLKFLRVHLPETQIVLGMRDIEDSPEATRAEWTAAGIYTLLEDVYDAILLYGKRSIFDPVGAYGLSPETAAKIIECGYICTPGTGRSPRRVRRELGLLEKPFILVTAGGGGDGFPLLDRTLAMFESGLGQSVQPLFVTGPFMPQDKRLQLETRGQASGIRVVDFTPDLTSYLAVADLVISMAGYNTVCEILTHRRQALLYPRFQVRQEQHMRAARMEELGLVRMLTPEDLEPKRLWAEIHARLNVPPPERIFPMDGLAQATRSLATLLQTGKARTAQTHPVSYLLAGRIHSHGLPGSREPVR